MPTKLTDEQRVRAAVPGCYPFGVMSVTIIAPDGEKLSKAFDCLAANPEYITESEAWAYATEHPRVQAHERKSEHMADTPELPEMDVTEEEVSEAQEWINRCMKPDRGGFADRRKHTATVIARGFKATGQLREAHATIAALRAPLTGPAMEAMARACAEAVWQMYREPHNLTWDALKERTFEAIAALVVETQGTLLAENRDVHFQYDAYKQVVLEAVFALGITPDGPDNNWRNTRAEAAEAKMRDLEAERDKLQMALNIACNLHGCSGGGCTPEAHAEDADIAFGELSALRGRVADLEAAAGAARRVCGHMAKRMREEYSLDITEEWMQAVANGEHDKVLPAKGASK